MLAPFSPPRCIGSALTGEGNHRFSIIIQSYESGALTPLSANELERAMKFSVSLLRTRVGVALGVRLRFCNYSIFFAFFSLFISCSRVCHFKNCVLFSNRLSRYGNTAYSYSLDEIIEMEAFLSLFPSLSGDWMAECYKRNFSQTPLNHDTCS